MHLQHKVRELEDELEMAAGKALSVSEEIENQDVAEVTLVSTIAAGIASLVVATSGQPKLTKE